MASIWLARVLRMLSVGLASHGHPTETFAYQIGTSSIEGSNGQFAYIISNDGLVEPLLCGCEVEAADE